MTGSVDINLIEIYDRSTMLLTKRHTNGKNDENKVDVLISGGEFYVNAMLDGMQLNPTSLYSIGSPIKNMGDIDQDMRLFNGLETCIGDDCDVTWAENIDLGIEIGEFQTMGSPQ